MRLPKKLVPGDTIGIFSPSSPITTITPKRFERSKTFLKNKGFKILEGNLTGNKDYYRSGSIEQRAEELNFLIRDPNVSCIMSTIGGMNSNSLLPYIDYQQLIKTPKIVIGYSDVTAILLGIYSMTEMITFYGPALVASFGEFPPFVDETYSYFSNILIEEKQIPYELPQPTYWTDEFIPWEEQNRSKNKQLNDTKILNNGVAIGRLVGGNLNTMQGIWGSIYMPPIKDGDILFIEDSEKNIATVERSFSLLKINGVFDKISGLIIGKHEHFDDMGTGRKNYDVLMEIIGEPHFPILADYDCSHTIPMLTMPLGCKIKLDCNNNKVSILEEWIY